MSDTRHLYFGQAKTLSELFAKTATPYHSGPSLPSVETQARNEGLKLKTLTGANWIESIGKSKVGKATVPIGPYLSITDHRPGEVRRSQHALLVEPTDALLAAIKDHISYNTRARYYFEAVIREDGETLISLHDNLTITGHWLVEFPSPPEEILGNCEHCGHPWSWHGNLCEAGTLSRNPAPGEVCNCDGKG